MIKAKDAVYVGVQALLLGALLVLGPRPSLGELHPVAGAVGGLLLLWSTVRGVLSILQLGSSLTPWPSPRSGSELVTSGVYAQARHPIYGAILVFGLGLSVLTLSWERLVVTALLGLLFYAKSSYEERLLRDRYSGYAAYAKSVRRFV